MIHVFVLTTANVSAKCNAEQTHACHITSAAPIRKKINRNTSFCLSNDYALAKCLDHHDPTRFGSNFSSSELILGLELDDTFDSPHHNLTVLDLKSQKSSHLISGRWQVYQTINFSRLFLFSHFW
jgi:hypothetical protein